MGKTAEEIKMLEGKIVKLVPMLEGIARGNVENRTQVAELMEHQSGMMEHQMAMMSDITAIRDDISAIRKALLFVFETSVSSARGGVISASDAQRAAKHIEELTRGGINALAKHNTEQALATIAKIKAASGSK